MRPVLQEIRADYLDGDERHPAREGGRLRIESTAATFYSGLPGDKRRPGPTHPFEAIVDVRVGGVVTGRKSGVGVAVVFGWPGPRPGQRPRAGATPHSTYCSGARMVGYAIAVTSSIAAGP